LRPVHYEEKAVLSRKMFPVEFEIHHEKEISFRVVP
jgi:hypothetical protein